MAHTDAIQGRITCRDMRNLLSDAWDGGDGWNIPMRVGKKPQNVSYFGWLKTSV